MDGLFELIDNRVQKQMNNGNYVLAAPAIITKALDNGMYVVNLISNRTELIVPNYSGTELDVDDNVQIFYKGRLLSERTAYIGAASYKPEGANRNKIKYITGSTSTVAVGEIPRKIAKIEYESVQNEKVFVSFNANITGTATGTNTIYIYMDEVLHQFQPTTSLADGQKINVSFLIPFDADIGSHLVEIRSGGTGTFTNIYTFVFGQGLLSSDDGYDITTEDDYIYDNGVVLYYIGTKLRPAIPEELGGVAVTKIEATAFSGTNVQAVKIPDGAEVIG